VDAERLLKLLGQLEGDVLLTILDTLQDMFAE
jgi:hypothetical protein